MKANYLLIILLIPNIFFAGKIMLTIESQDKTTDCFGIELYDNSATIDLTRLDDQLSKEIKNITDENNLYSLFQFNVTEKFIPAETLYMTFLLLQNTHKHYNNDHIFYNDINIFNILASKMNNQERSDVLCVLQSLKKDKAIFIYENKNYKNNDFEKCVLFNEKILDTLIERCEEYKNRLKISHKRKIREYTKVTIVGLLVTAFSYFCC